MTPEWKKSRQRKRRGGAPPAPISEVLDDYSALCDRPGMDAITSIMRDTLGKQFRVLEAACVTDHRQAGEWRGSIVGEMMARYDDYHLSVAGVAP